jgi:hypothetical protein
MQKREQKFRPLKINQTIITKNESTIPLRYPDILVSDECDRNTGSRF